MASSKNASTAQHGRWLFILGIILSLVGGIAAIPYGTAILFVVGLLVGFMHIPGKNSDRFLIAVTALLVIGAAGLSALSTAANIDVLVDTLMTILEQFTSFIAAAGLVVGIRSVLTIDK